MATPPFVPLLEEALNRFLALDPAVAERLARLPVRVIGVEVFGLPGPFYLSVAGGTVHLSAECAGEPDVWVRGGPFALARLALAADGERQVLEGGVEVHGEVGVLNELRAGLAGFAVDWEEQLARWVGDLPGHALGNQARALGGWLRGVRETLGLDLQEYLWEEGRLVPRPEAHAQFLAAVDTLRDDVERLAKRVERLAAGLGEG
jgi:ubiquinone biosynthesis protein UbiJ